MPENTGKEIAPLSEFEVLEQVDDQAIVQMMTGQAIKDYVYSFKQGGKVVEGLTLAGINEAANRRGGIEVDTIEHEERDKSWIAVVKAVDTITGSSRYGACEQPKNMGSRLDPHAFTKAIHKAQRNAIKQLLPVPVIKEVLNYYLHRQHETTPLASGPTKEEKLGNAQKATFALASKLKDKMEQQNIDQASFWQYVRARYAVESRNEMSEMQWTQLAAELTAASSKEELLQQFMERIKKISAATEESEVTTTQPSEDEPIETVVVVETEPVSAGERPSVLPF
ncbi:hypothetical protein CMK14_12430 [Candidatus Poribacteria bacterium]|jgi:hypothetical protein|nr:hypothetical protein [Candidatus Poribacteria bacterium]